jgi:hypothetical protein
MELRIIEINNDEKPVTATTAIDITNATWRDDVTANAEQIPKTCKVIGLLSTKGSTRSSLFVCDIRLPPTLN